MESFRTDCDCLFLCVALSFCLYFFFLSLFPFYLFFRKRNNSQSEVEGLTVSSCVATGSGRFQLQSLSRHSLILPSVIQLCCVIVAQADRILKAVGWSAAACCILLVV